MAHDIELPQDAGYSLFDGGEFHQIRGRSDRQTSSRSSCSGGQIAPALEAANEVGRGSIEMAQTASYYYGQGPSLRLRNRLALQPQCRQQNGWMYYGGGIKMMNDFYAGII